MSYSLHSSEGVIKGFFWGLHRGILRGLLRGTLVETIAKLQTYIYIHIYIYGYTRLILATTQGSIVSLSRNPQNPKPQGCKGMKLLFNRLPLLLKPPAPPNIS